MKKLVNLKGFNALTSEQLKLINGGVSTTISTISVVGEYKRCKPCINNRDCGSSSACATDWPPCGKGKRCM